MKKYDRFLIRDYLMAALHRALRDKPLAAKLLGWIGASEDELEMVDAGFLAVKFRELGLDDADESDPHFAFGGRRRSSGRRRGTGHRRAPAGARTKDFLAWAVKAVERSVAEPPPEGAEARATALAARRFQLDRVCGPLLELARLYDDRRSPVENLWDTVKDAVGDPLEASAVLLGTSRGRVEKSLRRLTEVGIADADNWSRSGAQPDDYVADWFARVYRPPVADERELRERLVPPAPEPLLEMDAFDHLDAGKDAVRLLTAANESRESVRLLFYGRAGTGKTEFAKTLVRECGGRLYDLCEPESGGVWGEEQTNRRMDRSADKRNRLRMALALLRSEPGAAILCDEVEDVLSSRDGSRRENHGLLEDAAVPIVFTGNDLSKFDEAMLRRFDLTMHFKAHSPTRRRSVVRRMVANSGVASLQGETLEPLAFRLADELECPPGIIERAIHITRLLRGSPEDLLRFAERHERTISTHVACPRLGAPVKAKLSWEAFAHLGQPADDFRHLLAATLCARRDGRAEGRGISFLAYGPPGCGKTEFCRTVAAEVGATLYSVGGKEQGPDARLAVPRSVSLEFAIEALTEEPEAIILFDELEDYGSASKQWLNGLVEKTPVPLLFTANSIGALRWMPYFLERLTYSLEFRHIPRSEREAIFDGLLGGNGSAEMAPLARELATNRRVTPRQVRNARLVASLSGGGVAAARRAVGEKAQLLRGKRTAEPKAVGAVRLLSGPRRPGPRGAHPADREGRPPPNGDPARRPVRERQIGVRQAARPADGPRSAAEARFRPGEQVGRRDRAADRGGLCRGARDGELPHHRRGGLLPRRPPRRPPQLGDQPRQRDAEPTRKPRPPLCVHHEPRRPPRPGGGPPLPLPGDLQVSGPGPRGPRLDVLLRRRVSGAGADPDVPGPGRLRPGPRARRETRLPQGFPSRSLPNW